MAKPQLYSELKAKAEQEVPDTKRNHEVCLGETQALTLPEREYDAVQALICNKREPNEEVKNAIERLKDRTW